MAGGKALAANVYVDGALYGPAGKKPSDEVAKRITNPKAWGKSAKDDEPAAAEFPEGDPSEDWKVDELKAYAASKEIDLGDASKKADLVSAILGKAAENA